MIDRKSPREIECMRRAGEVVAEALALCERLIAPGVATAELDKEVEALIRKRNGVPLFKGYRPSRRATPYPASICASVNEEVVHGIPGPRRLREGDIISIDIGVRLDRYCADAARTWPVGRISDEARRLLDVARAALDRATETVRAGMRLTTLSRAVQTYVELNGFSVVRNFTGHGIGREMHEEPQIPNFVTRSMNDPVVPEGAVLAIEPMVNAGRPETEVLANEWTVVTKDRSLSAHYENTVAVGKDGPQILTALCQQTR